MVCIGESHCGVHRGDSLWYAVRAFTVVCIEGIHLQCGVDCGGSLLCVLRGFTVVCKEGLRCGWH